MLAKLISSRGGGEIVIANDLTLVGRHREYCDVIVDATSVSKLHCVIVKTDGLLFVRDLGSTNGTQVNGQRITRGALLPGDELSFAKEKFVVFLGPDESTPQAVDHTDLVTEYDMPAVASPSRDRSDEDVEVVTGDSVP